MGVQPQQNQNRALLLVIGAIALLFLACCAIAGIGLFSLGTFRTLARLDSPGARVSETLPEQSIAVVAPLALTIDDPVGTIAVRAGAGDEIRVEATRFAPDRETLQQIDVELAGSGDTATLTVTGPRRGSNWGADLVVRVPRASSLMVEAGVGAVTVEGLEGAFNIRAGVGAITATDLVVREDSSFEGGTSDVRVDARVEEGVVVRASSGVGTVTIVLPAGTGFELDASTGTGNVAWQGFELEMGQEPGRQIGAEVHTRTVTDPAGRRLILNSGVGDITVRAR